MPVTISDYVDAIAAWLERCGVRVCLRAPELPAAGLYRSETRQIWINEPSAMGALLTLAHEAGHWLGYLIDEKPHSYQRERQAYVYGWYVLRWFDAPVTREEWRRDCRTSHALRADGVVETRHLFREHDPVARASDGNREHDPVATR